MVNVARKVLDVELGRRQDSGERKGVNTMGSQQYCLRWNNHQTAVLSGFAKLLENEALVDVTIACGGIRIKAHKVVLSACSPYFQEIFEENPCKHPVVILKGFTFQDLKSMVDFMYKGEVNVDQKHLADFLKTAEELQISGLVDMPASSSSAAGVDAVNEDRQQTLNAAVRSSEGAVRAVPVQHEHHGAQIAACNELRERLRSSDGGAMRNSSASASASVVSNDYEDSESNRLMQHKSDQNDHRHRQHLELDPNDGGAEGTQNNYMDSDCDGSLPMCPVDAELHVKEEVEILEEDLSVVNDESQLLLERLTRPHSSSDGVSTATSVTRTFDLPSASNAQGVPSTVQMLESLPGHSSWNTTATPASAPTGLSRSRDPASSAGTDSAKRMPPTTSSSSVVRPNDKLHKALRAIRQGMSQRRASETYGVSVKRIRNQLRRSGTAAAAAMAISKTDPHRLQLIEKAVRDIEGGMTQKQACENYGISTWAVWNYHHQRKAVGIMAPSSGQGGGSRNGGTQPAAQRPSALLSKLLGSPRTRATAVSSGSNSAGTSSSATSSQQPAAHPTATVTWARRGRIRTDEPEAARTCHFCRKVFANIHTKNRHLRYSHSERAPKSFICEHCPSNALRSYNRKDNLYYHIKIHHPEVKRAWGQWAALAASGRS